MKCKTCEKDFEPAKVEMMKPYDRGDGVMYGGGSYSYDPICPHCGKNNGLRVHMESSLR